MAMATSNRLLPILAGSVLLILVFVTTKSCSPDEEAAVVLDSVPEAPAPDADTPADTIKTLTANVAAMTTEVEALRRATGRKPKPTPEKKVRKRKPANRSAAAKPRKRPKKTR